MEPTSQLDGIDFEYECRKLLKDLLHEKKLTYKGLAELLCRAGLDETEKSIAHKAMRGTFRLSFYLRVLKVLDVNVVALQVPMSKDDLARLVGPGGSSKKSSR
jgi:hypothetical protein